MAGADLGQGRTRPAACDGPDAVGIASVAARRLRPLLTVLNLNVSHTNGPHSVTQAVNVRILSPEVCNAAMNLGRKLKTPQSDYLHKVVAGAAPNRPP